MKQSRNLLHILTPQTLNTSPLKPFPNYPHPHKTLLTYLSLKPRERRVLLPHPMDFPSYPDEFRCPISLDIMTDPVILTSGHTFDRASIQRWLDGGNLTCPVTNLPLPGYPHLPLIPNHALRRLIQSSLPAPQQPRKSPPCPSIPSLSFPSDLQSLSSLLSSLKKFADLRREVAESDAPAVLIRHVASPHLPDLQKLAIYSLLYLSLDGDDVKVGLVAEGAVDALAAAIKSGGASAAAAATVITSLATVDVNKVSIGAHPTAIAGLAAMLGEGSSKKEKKEAATAIYELCKFPENRRRTVRAGAVRPLVGLADSELDRAVEVLAQLAKLKEGREEMNKVESFIRILVGVLRGRAQRAIENSLSVLNWVCLEEEKARREALDEGVIEILAELVNEESGRIAKYAMGLLQTLQRGEM